jgi:hypothetical protein
MGYRVTPQKSQGQARSWQKKNCPVFLEYRKEEVLKNTYLEGYVRKLQVLTLPCYCGLV